MGFIASISPLSVLSGFIIGMLVGLTGVGGGSLMTPLLILVFGTHTATAVGTDLLYASITKAAGSVSHGRKQNIDWPIVGKLAAGSIPGAVLTIIVLHLLRSRGYTSSQPIKIILGVALVLSAAAVMARPFIRHMIDRHAGERRRWTTAATVLCGLVLGVMVTISSVGAGALGMTMLVILYPGVRLVRLVGSDVAHAVPLTLVGGIGHFFLGDIDWHLLVSLLIGSVPGITLGSHMSSRMPERVLRPILAVILVIVGIRMVL